MATFPEFFIVYLLPLYLNKFLNRNAIYGLQFLHFLTLRILELCSFVFFLIFAMEKSEMSQNFSPIGDFLFFQDAWRINRFNPEVQE